MDTNEPPKIRIIYANFFGGSTTAKELIANKDSFKSRQDYEKMNTMSQKEMNLKQDTESKNQWEYNAVERYLYKLDKQDEYKAQQQMQYIVEEQKRKDLSAYEQMMWDVEQAKENKDIVQYVYNNCINQNFIWYNWLE
ncbi:hypothetical protein B8A33_02800 [Dolosigranulum pigrum]|uniref:hypothetical protein n=1 Tax=Dolosigranulum pigrum TaxID=29394 RepID=UPI000DC03081|nr:hypothetical protein [Dolosigranulum pigrum]RAN57092.1 hypothetical protein B8A33_02800 [Dolosigranulum pigrum]